MKNLTLTRNQWKTIANYAGIAKKLDPSLAPIRLASAPEEKMVMITLTRNQWTILERKAQIDNNTLSNVVILKPGNSYATTTKEAIQNGQQLRFTYTKKDGSSRTVNISPVTLVGDAGVKGVDLDDPAKTQKMFLFNGISEFKGQGDSTPQSSQPAQPDIPFTYETALEMFNRSEPLSAKFDSRIHPINQDYYVYPQAIETGFNNFTFFPHPALVEGKKWSLSTSFTKYHEEEGLAFVRYRNISETSEKLSRPSILNDVATIHEWRYVDSYLINKTWTLTAADRQRVDEIRVGPKGSGDKAKTYLEDYCSYPIKQAEQISKPLVDDINQFVEELKENKEAAEIFFGKLSLRYPDGKLDTNSEKMYDFRKTFTNISKALELKSLIPMTILEELIKLNLTSSGWKNLEETVNKGSPSRLNLDNGYILGIDEEIKERNIQDPRGQDKITITQKEVFNGRTFTLAYHYVREDKLGS